jgi:hypothetical protein
MVVATARTMWRGNGTSLKALVEYGMMGLREAAAPPRPSKTKKGQMVGFTGEHRFGTYARHYADKEMRAALADDPGPAIKSDEFPKAAVEAENWHSAPSLRGILPDTPEVLRDLIGRQPYFKPYRPWTLWNPPAWHRPQKPRPRNFIKHPRAETEHANRADPYGRGWQILKGYEAAARDVMECWSDDEEAGDAGFMIASLFRSHAFKGKEFRLEDSGCDSSGR